MRHVLGQHVECLRHPLAKRLGMAFKVVSAKVAFGI